MTDSFTVNIQGSLAKFSLSVTPASTIKDVKENIAELSEGTDAGSIRLIYSGRILKDDQTIDGCGISAGHTIHLVKSVKPATSSQSNPAASDVAAATASTSQPVRTPLNIPSIPPGSITRDPQSAAQALNFAAQNPEFFASVAESMPDFQNLPPETRGVFRNPQLMAAMAGLLEGAQNPENATPERIQRQQEQLLQFQNLMLQHVASTNPGRVGEVNGAFQDLMFGGGGAPPTLSPTLATSPEPITNPEERFATQLLQLQEMGFWDKDSNINALKACNGSVSQAIEWLLAHPPQ